MRIISIAIATAVLGLSSQAVALTHTVTVNGSGTFSPPILVINSGDTVRWNLNDAKDAIIPATGSWPAICSSPKPYTGLFNDFVGPMPMAPSGLFVRGLSYPWEALAVVAPASCNPNDVTATDASTGNVLCEGAGPDGAIMDSTYQSPNVTGVYIKPLWRDLNPSYHQYEFESILGPEIDKAVHNGKLYSLAVRAGKHGTPDWIFSTDAAPAASQNDPWYVGAARVQPGSDVTRLHFRDGGSDIPDDQCGSYMDLGDPTEPAYQAHYLEMLHELAVWLKQRADRYRALGYIKPSGANLFTDEARLPKTCKDNIWGTDTGYPCFCNTQIFAHNGYTPSGLYAFYDAQIQQLDVDFPRKALNYQLIQAGFPRVNDAGDWMDAFGNSGMTGGVPNPPFPGGTEQTETILDNGQAHFAGDPIRWVVQHNGLGPKPDPATLVCDQDGQHPKTDPVVHWSSDSGCPNWWAVSEGAEGQPTGFQTNNGGEVGSYADLDSALRNGYDNSDAAMIEIYEERLWDAEVNGLGLGIRVWNSSFKQRRPPPLTHQHTLYNVSGSPVVHRYIHGSKCTTSGQYGTIVVNP